MVLRGQLRYCVVCEMLTHRTGVIVDSQLAERRAVGALIRDRRLRKGLTQEELADIVGLTQRYISKIEVNV
jgi:ribosome-binding protein aMBF1 (putative translation factor)